MNRPQVILSFIALMIFQLRHRGCVIGVVIFPPEVASVCSGGQLELTCTVAGTFLEWSFFLVPEGETMARRFFRTIHLGSATSDLEVNFITFTFLRISAEGSQPITSRLLITPVSDGLNGIEVNCTDVVASNTSSTHIKVINESTVISRNQNIEVTTVSKQFGREAVTVMYTLLLTELDFLGYSYHVNATPQLNSQPFIDYHSTMNNITVKVEVSYNIHYNVSILAASPCGKNSLTNFTQVYFANCGNPADRIDNTIVDIMGFTYPAIEGSNVTISCSSGHDTVWNGTAIAICGEDSEWEPDLQEISLNCSAIDELDVTGIMASNNIIGLGAILGITVGAVVLILSVVVIVLTIVVFHLRARDTNDHDNGTSEDCQYERYALNTESGFNMDHHKSTTNALVYADIGQPSFCQQQSRSTSTHLLDDDAVEYAKLNHNLLVPSKALKTNIEPANNNTCVNLDNVLIQLRPQVTRKWRQFGEAVGIEKEVLDSCAKTCSSSPEDCIVEMLDYWLRNSLVKPTWKDIARALKAINLPQLAHGIEMVYSTGKLPVDVDMNQVSEFQKGSFDERATVTDHESPPPLPPKMFEDDESGLPEELRVVTETQVPALPPKPVNKSAFH